MHELHEWCQIIQEFENHCLTTLENKIKYKTTTENDKHQTYEKGDQVLSVVRDQVYVLLEADAAAGAVVRAAHVAEVKP